MSSTFARHAEVVVVGGGPRCRLVATILALICGLTWATAFAQSGAPTPVTPAHLADVRTLFTQNGLAGAEVVLDAQGRIELKGAYADEREVDRAFSLAQTVVGVKWVSPITPENIKVKEWERKLGGLFSRANVITPPVRSGAAPGPVRNRFGLVVGVGRYQYKIRPLEFAERDASSFYLFLTDPNRGRFSRDGVTYLVNENATRANITAALDRIRTAASEDDLVVIYVSSHGSPPDKNGVVNIATYDTEPSPRDRVWYTSLTQQAIGEFVNGLRAQRLVIILDTCFSNGAYKDVPGFLPPGGKSLGADDNEGYGMSKASGQRALGAKDLVLEDRPAPGGSAKSVRIGSTDDAWGRVLIGASGANEQSWESDQLNNSIFTYYFIDGLNRSQGSVQNAFYYAQPRVYQRVKQEKGADIEQSPQVMATQSNWNMRLVPAASR